jgi:DNA-binding PadR family transcriptional regulator
MSQTPSANSSHPLGQLPAPAPARQFPIPARQLPAPTRLAASGTAGLVESPDSQPRRRKKYGRYIVSIYFFVMLDLAILGLLEERDFHGYEIRRQLRENLGLLANVSFGSIYPALTRLERVGALVAVADEPSGPAGPSTGSLSGERAAFRNRRHAQSRSRRGKKVYRITDAGRQLFAQLLAEGGASDDARSFGLRLAFARHLAPQARLALLERRRALLVQRLGESEPARPDLDVYARSVVQHTADGVAHDISWLDHLIVSERAALAGVSEPVP